MFSQMSPMTMFFIIIVTGVIALIIVSSSYSFRIDEEKEVKPGRYVSPNGIRIVMEKTINEAYDKTKQAINNLEGTLRRREKRDPFLDIATIQNHREDAQAMFNANDLKALRALTKQINQEIESLSKE